MRLRKVLFWVVTVMAGVGLLIIIITFIIAIALFDEWIGDACRELDTQEQYDACRDWAFTILVIAFAITVVVDSIFVFITIQVLYYGWKEQEQIQARGDEQTQALNQHGHGAPPRGGAQVQVYHQVPVQPVQQVMYVPVQPGQQVVMQPGQPMMQQPMQA